MRKLYKDKLYLEKKELLAVVFFLILWGKIHGPPAHVKEKKSVRFQ